MPSDHNNSRASEYTTLLPATLRRRVTIAHEGESGRSGFHPRHFFHVLWLSSCTVSKWVNVLWPLVPVAFLLHFLTRAHLWTFAVSYVAMVPAANLGSILTNLLLCLGLCFFFGGIRWTTQKFHPIVSEVGSGLLLVAAFALLIPSAFYSALKSETVPDLLGALHERFTEGKLQEDVLRISQTTSIVLIVAFFLYIWYCASSQHSIFDEVIEMDELNDADREADEAKPKFTMTETVLALAVSIVVVTLLLVFLVDNIEHVVESGVPDQFLGLILLPLVEKAAEHLTAIDEAWGKLTRTAPGGINEFHSY